MIKKGLYNTISFLTDTPVIAGCAAFFVLAATCWLLVISVTPSDIFPIYKYIGLQNYHRLWVSDRWWLALGNMGVFTVITIIGSVCFGYLTAACVDAGAVGRGAALYVMTLPMALAPSVAGEISKQILSGKVLSFYWVGASVDLSAILSSPIGALFTLAAVAIWQQGGVCCVIMLVGLRRVEAEVKEALRLEGVSTVRLYLSILPSMLRPYIAGVAVLAVNGAFRTYDLLMTLTGGGPGFSTDLPSHFIIEQAIERQDLALSATGATIMFILSGVAAVTPALASYSSSWRCK